MNTLWEWICRYKVAITAVFAAVAIGAAAVVTVISVSRRRARAAQAAVTTTQTAEQTDATTAVVTTTELIIAPVTTALTTKTTRKTTVRTTTRRTVAPPPIVVEPDNVKDDTVKTPDASVTKPAATPDTKNGVTLQYVRESFEGSKYIIGMDVSRHQEEIDWKKVKAAGIEFAMIRCGYRTTVGGKVYEDANFKKNIEGALDAGVKVGIYFFSAAVNETEVLEEAAFVIEVLKPYKDRISYPVAYDFEILGQDRAKYLTATAMTDNAIAYMDTVADAGYIPMLYASRNALWDKWEMGRLSAYRVWLAQYVNLLSQKRYNGAHVMWQCASDGRVDGIGKDVDLNIAYTDLSRVSTPYLSKVDPKDFEKAFPGFTFNPVCEEVEAIAGVNARISPYTDRPNKWTSVKAGERMVRTGIDTQNGWSRLDCNGVTVYIPTKSLRFLRTTQTTERTTTATTTVTATDPAATGTTAPTTATGTAAGGTPTAATGSNTPTADHPKKATAK